MRVMLHNKVEIDLCPDCRGCWLDRGELQKILSLPQKDSLSLRQLSAKPEPSLAKSEGGTRDQYDFEQIEEVIDFIGEAAEFLDF